MEQRFNKSDRASLGRAAGQQGFTLIEVLVSALVLVVGILGVAALQVTALKNLQSSGNHGVAAMLTNDIADRMWVNQNVAASYAHKGMPGNVPKDCVANDCIPTDLAAHDVYDWQLQINGYTIMDGLDEISVPAVLPSGSGEVENLGGDSYRITLRWDDDRSGSTGTKCPPESDDDLDCYVLTLNF